ncbi:hypothetical protein Pcinc_034586 [Petrolisthes cinctipes]|uniref:Uncharacterized protein n=1 Tax=Petrolisthes cinctipes TaxID=88211 RepID=A0AAE1C1B6_PETCI|nr:hypothetical protein Pcinc_034586 [Petrolisthes cinctipes]
MTPSLFLPSFTTSTSLLTFPTTSIPSLLFPSHPLIRTVTHHHYTHHALNPALLTLTIKFPSALHSMDRPMLLTHAILYMYGGLGGWLLLSALVTYCTHG